MSRRRNKQNRQQFVKKQQAGPQSALIRHNKVHIPVVENLAGFAVETALPGEMVKIQARASLVSDMPLFYTYIDQISSIFLKTVLAGQVYQFLVLIHQDLSADLYLNDFPVKVLMMAKRSLKKGEVVRTDDIADIRELTFEGIKIKDSDKVIYCFKVGWKFGLFLTSIEGIRLTYQQWKKRSELSIGICHFSLFMTFLNQNLTLNGY